MSKSQLDMVALSPALLQWQKSAPVDTEKLKALDMGTALHCLLLEPEEFDKRFIVAPQFNLRTNQESRSGSLPERRREHGHDGNGRRTGPEAETDA